MLLCIAKYFVTFMNDTRQAAEDLAYIRAALQASQRATALSAAYYVIWGGVSSVGLVATWALLRTGAPERAATWWVLWGSCIALGWVLTAWQVWREARRSPAVNVATRRLGLSWAGVGIGISLCYFAGTATGAVAWPALSGLVAVFLGLGLWLNGLHAGIRWLMALALPWWLGAVILWVWPGPHALLVLAAMSLLLFTLPGWWLGRASGAADGA